MPPRFPVCTVSMSSSTIVWFSNIIQHYRPPNPHMLEISGPGKNAMASGSGIPKTTPFPPDYHVVHRYPLCTPRPDDGSEMAAPRSQMACEVEVALPDRIRTGRGHVVGPLELVGSRSTR